MSKIRPVSDLRNYNQVLDRVKEDSPVYLTKNGRGRYVVVDIEEYERDKAKLTLLSELAKGMKSGNEEGWLTLEDFDKKFGIDE